MDRFRGSWQFWIQHCSEPNATNFHALSGCAHTRHFLLHICPTMPHTQTTQLSSNNKHIFQTQTPTEMYRFCKGAEVCMALTTQISVLLFHFREATLLYTLTGSKIGVNLLASSSPYPSYKTLQTWNDDLAKDKSNDPGQQTGDIAAVFDDNQVLQRRWQIAVENNVRCNVITVVATTNVDKNTSLQFQEQLTPDKWSNNFTAELTNTLQSVPDAAGHKKVKYSSQFYSWLQMLLDEVVQEQNQTGDQLVDTIDSEVIKNNHRQNFKTCVSCQFVDVPKRARKCPQCGSTSSFQKEADDNPCVDLHKGRYRGKIHEDRYTVTAGQSKKQRLSTDDDKLHMVPKEYSNVDNIFNPNVTPPPPPVQCRTSYISKPMFIFISRWSL